MMCQSLRLFFQKAHGVLNRFSHSTSDLKEAPLWHKLSKNCCCVLKQTQVEIGFVVYHASHGTAMILSGSVFPISAARAAPLAMESVSSSSALRSVVFRKGTSP